MRKPDSASDLTIITDVMDTVRHHPHMFINPLLPINGQLHDSICEGIVVLGITNFERFMHDEWHIVGANEDWFSMGRFQIPENLKFSCVPSFPEAGVNSIRAEFNVAAFAKDIVVMGGRKIMIAKGEISEDDPIADYLKKSTDWQRAIAFR
jgi:hypothetical protein